MARVHLIGIGGSGMRPLVPHLLARGDEVSGSDRGYDPAFQHPVFRSLLEMGVRLLPQDGTGSATAEAVVVSTAVEEGVPDLAIARARGIPVLHRSEILAELAHAARSSAREAVGVAGTSGKTSTAGMLAWILERAGADPGVYLGGSIGGTEDPVRAAARVGAGPFVFEADESDRSIERHTPSLAILTSVSEDHLPLAEVRGLFLRFVGKAARVVSRRGLLDEIGWAGSPPLLEPQEEVPTRAPGLFNRRNAAMALCAARALSVPDSAAREALLTFPGMKRRLEPAGTTASSARVFDDFAHNPEKVASVLAALKEVGSPLVVVFQPHGFGPARMMKDGLARAFAEGMRKGDRVIFLPIFDAGGTADRSISSSDLAAAVRARGGDAEAMEDRATARARARDAARAATADGGVVCVMGARDESLGDFAREIAAAVS